MLIQSIRKERQTMDRERRAIDEERRNFFQRIQQERFEGRREGILEGELRGKLEVARSMLQEGLSVELIVKITQLSQEDIEKLKD